MNLYTDPKFIEGFPVTISPAGNIENETEERITNDIINAAPGPSFVFAELGAGYGRWSAHVALYAKEHRPDLRTHIIAVEPEPTHFQWLQEHMANNGVTDMTLIDRPITASEKWVLFQVGSPATWYGQGVVSLRKLFRVGKPTRLVRSISLEEIFSGIPTIDMINMDIQGEELAVLSAASHQLLRKIRWLYIGTHSTGIEQGLKELLPLHGFHLTYELPQNVPFGVTDGIQVWRREI